jgi:putative ABC transport system permease protein
MNALDRKLFRDLLRWRGQLIAIALVVACGIASFVTMVSTYDSLKLSQATYYNTYRFAQVFVQLKRAPETLASGIQAIPGVAQVQTRVVRDVSLDIPGRKEPATGRLVSIPEQQAPMLNDLYIRQGRYIEAQRRDEILVSEAFAQANHLQLNDTIGAVINGRWQRLRIVGTALSPEYVYEIQGAGVVLPDNERFGVIWMGRDTLSTAFNMKGAFNDVALTLAPHANPATVMFELDQLLKQYGGQGAYGREDQLSNRFLSDEIAELETMGTLLPAIFLGIAAFLLNILLSRLVSTQREQIAVLKAFGYSNRAIGLHYLKFVGVIVLLGTCLGMLVGLRLGAFLTHYYTNFFQFPVLRYTARISMLLTALLISSGSAVLGAFLSVQRVVKLPPAAAMRPEPPTDYRPTLLERLGLQWVLSPAGRMILRNLARKPIQAVLSTLGMALAVAMLVVGLFLGDAIDYMIAVSFYHVQRQDVTLTFNEGRSARTQHEIAHLPGVLSIEPFRAVSARLRFRNRAERVGLLGLDPTGELRRLVDRHLQVVDLPPEGIVLTQKLAEMLHVQPGELLTVEVLEEDRPTRTLPVAGLVDELVDISGYMDIQALHRLMQKGETLSGAFLTVDPMSLDQLYKVLKRTPAVTEVTVNDLAIVRFRKTIGETIGILTRILMLFASVIAFGVVYNAARIALSERSLELATLRIIGFSQRQVATILLGEQAILTLAALPVGAVIGYWLSGLLSRAMNRESFRLPLIVAKDSYAIAFLVVAIAAFLSGFMVYRQLVHLDLIGVLKTKE